MQSQWQTNEAQNFQSLLDLRVYTSRLLGQDKTLVLHGGGNTSVKITQENILGEQEEVLYVKGSGWDLETIEAAGFSPVQMAHLLKLAKLNQLSDSQMVNELKTHLLDASAPGPSVETILHALLPYTYVDHTHSDAIVSITNTADGEQRIREIYGDTVVIIPYVMPGFDLSKLCAKNFPEQQNENTIGMVLMNHGIFSFANDAQTSYERMIALVEKAEQYLQKNNALSVSHNAIPSTQEISLVNLAKMRQQLSRLMNQAVIILNDQSDATLSFCQHQDIERISQQGPATPDHVIRTKRLPLLTHINQYTADLEKYVSDYNNYFKSYSTSEQTILDRSPRVILDPDFGLFSVGKNVKEAQINIDIYQHTMDIIRRSELLDRYQALDAKDIFDVEYWELEQAKLKKAGAKLEFSGEIALVTGAASGIGQACVESLLAQGASVVGLDIDPSIATVFTNHPSAQAFTGIICDLADEGAISNAIKTTISTYGGLDMLVLNAGIFPKACLLQDMPSEHWNLVMKINCDANMLLLRESHPYLSLAPNGGRVAIIGSKNVPAPGPGAAAYSASKAALNQLVRVTAMEWGKDNIRLNSVHPNAVFDTAIWTDEVLNARAKHYGMTVDEYKANNVLKTEVTSQHVAELAISMCGHLFEKTTAAQVPIDGGNDRVI